MWQLTAGAALVAAVLGFFSGVRWEEGAQSLALESQKARYEEQLNDQKAEANQKGLDHANTLADLNQQLVDVTEQRDALTTGRPCLSGRAVGVLNAINVPRANVGTAAAQSASAAEGSTLDSILAQSDQERAKSSDSGPVASDRDLFDAVAVCRTRYSEVADQLNKILDIEDSRDAAALRSGE